LHLCLLKTKIFQQTNFSSVFSASGGIFLNYRLNKKWVIQSGLSYSWSNSILDPSESYAVKNNNGNIQFRVNTISGYGYLQPSSPSSPNVGDSVLTDKAYSKLHYLTIPLNASYRVSLKRFTLLGGAGVTFNFLTDATVETKILGSPFDQHESVVTLYGLKKINYGILLKAELQYKINSDWGISLIPCFKNALSPINIHSVLSTYPYNFGIGLGVNYRF
jgi:lipopolysaccharide assembly outer membrane protein LptD (OstA)